MDKINPKDCQVSSPLVIQGFSNFFTVVSSDYYGKLRNLLLSKRTPTSWSIPQGILKPPNERNSFINCWLFQVILANPGISFINLSFRLVHQTSRWIPHENVFDRYVFFGGVQS